MPNVRIPNHPLVGVDATYRADLPAYDPSADTEDGTLIIGAGMAVTIWYVFENWNDVPGLDMLYVFVPATGHHTHVTPDDLGLSAVTA